MEGALGGLTTKVDALVKAVDSHGDKIDDIRLKVSFVKGSHMGFGRGACRHCPSGNLVFFWKSINYSFIEYEKIFFN